jgi:MFS transporter, DHA3 family, macrolide efflux protein
VATQFSESEKPYWRRTFFPIWVGQSFSLFGSRLVTFAIMWHLAATTQRAVVLTITALVGLLPELLLMPFAGACVDRWNRRRILIISDALIAIATFALAILFFLQIEQLWHIYILMFIRAISGAFHNPAMKASTSLLVPKERLTNIAGLNQFLDSALEIVTPALGAIAIATLSIGGVLLIDMITALMAIIPLLFVAIPQPDRKQEDKIRTGPLRALTRDVKSGFRYVIQWKGLFYAFLFATVSNFFILPAFNLLPIMVSRDFQYGVDVLAITNTIIGIAMAVGSIIISIWGGFKRKMFTMAIGVSMMGVGFLFFGLAPFNRYLFVLIGAAIFGLYNPFLNAPMSALLQESVAPEMQGRVFSLLVTTARAAIPLGMIVAGPLADQVNVQTWYIAGGIYCLIMGVSLVSIPAIRNLDRGRSGDDLTNNAIAHAVFITADE